MQKQENTGMSRSQFIIRHSILLLVAIAILASVYYVWQNTTSVVVLGIILIATHLVAVAIIFFGGRNIVKRLYRKMHGIPAPDKSNQ